MLKFRTKVFVKKEDIELLQNDINAKESYIVYSNEEKGTKALDIIAEMQEEFHVSEETLDTIIEELLLDASEDKINASKEKVKSFLREMK